MLSYKFAEWEKATAHINHHPEVAGHRRSISKGRHTTVKEHTAPTSQISGMDAGSVFTLGNPSGNICNFILQNELWKS
jgi:hypothetical protein